MHRESRVIFYVGSHEEAGEVEAAGYEAVTCSMLDAGELASEAVKLARKNAAGIVVLEDHAAVELAQAFERAGAVYHLALLEDAIRALNDGSVAAWCRLEADRAIRTLQADRLDAQRRQLERLGVWDVSSVALEISSGTSTYEAIPTGLAQLDKALDGGLPAGGLVTLGAISSTGKTTLALQIADNIAASGRPVLFVTVEQGRHELVAKSISRLMRTGHKDGEPFTIASSLTIRSDERRAAWSLETEKAFRNACARYAVDIAGHLRIMETDRQPTTLDIVRAAEIVAEHEGRPPVTFIDYLQLLAPADARMTEKQAVDRNVMDLRHLARDMGTCVFAISSLNRASYSGTVTLEAFKESGAIEYGSDVLIGLQPRGLEDRLDNSRGGDAGKRTEARKAVDAFKRATRREAELVVLKNRHGALPEKPVALDYDALSSLFTCAPEPRATHRTII